MTTTPLVANPPAPSALLRRIPWAIVCCHLVGDALAVAAWLAWSTPIAAEAAVIGAAVLLRQPAVLLIIRLAQRARHRHRYSKPG